MTTSFEFVNPVQDYVLAPQTNSNFAQVTNTNTSYTSGNYPPLPLGNIDIQVSWAGANNINIWYLPDGKYANRKKVGEILTGEEGTVRRAFVSLAVDNPEAKLLITTPVNLDLDWRVGLKIIQTRINFT